MSGLQYPAEDLGCESTRSGTGAAGGSGSGRFAVLRIGSDAQEKGHPFSYDAGKNYGTGRSEILAVVSQYVRPGGRMVYSTCTISRQENEENAMCFLKEHTDFKMLSSRQILPGPMEGDGFYIAHFRKEP